MFLGFISLLLIRLVLGIGESAAYPAYSKILSAVFPEQKRGLANAVIDLGTKAGPALGLLLGLLIPRLGWRFFFVSIGAASLLWLVPWLRYGPGGLVMKRTGGDGPGLLRIASRREAWATFLGLFCFNYTFYFLLTWLPSYLVMERHFSMDMMSLYGALPFCATAVTSVTCGWLSDRIIASGRPVGSVRRSFAVSGLLLCGLNLPLVLGTNHIAAMSFLVLAFVGIGMFTSNVWAITQTMAGSEAVGQWTGLQNAIGNLGGVVAPIVTAASPVRTPCGRSDFPDPKGSA
jgi:MFS family permease